MKPRQPKSSPLEISSLSAIGHLVEHRPHRVLSLNLSTETPSPRVKEICDRASAAGIAVQRRRSSTKDGGGPLTAQIASFEYADWRQVIDGLGEVPKALVLALDHLQDPQNFGALCRSADAFGVDAILTPQARSTAVTAVVYNTSAGAVETVPILNPANLGEALRRLKKNGFWIVGSALSERAVPLPQATRFEKTVLVLGTEGEGLSPLIRDLCDVLVEIPMQGRVQSLNVSAAGAVLLYALRNSN